MIEILLVVTFCLHPLCDTTTLSAAMMKIWAMAISQKLSQAWLLGMERPCFVFARIHSRRSPNGGSKSQQMSRMPILSAIDQRRSPIGNDGPPIGSLVAILRFPRAHGLHVRWSYYL